MDVVTPDGVVTVAISSDAYGFIYLGCQKEGVGLTQVPKLTPEEAREIGQRLIEEAEVADSK